MAAIAGCFVTSQAEELVRGPVTGFIHDETAGALRAVRGIPGAAVLSSSILSSHSIRLAAFAPGKDLALIVPASGPSLLLVRGMLAGAPLVEGVDAVTASPDVISISETGDAALLYFAREHEFQFVSNLEAQRKITPRFSPEPLGMVRAVAVHSQDRALLVTQENGQSRVWLLQWSGSEPSAANAIPIGIFGCAVAVEFKDRESAFIADRENSQLFLVRDLNGSREVRLIADGRDGISNPAAIRKMGASLLVANSGSSTIQVYDLQREVLETTIETPVAPRRLDPMMSRHVLAINQPDGAPLYVFDELLRKVFFVPAEQLAQ